MKKLFTFLLIALCSVSISWADWQVKHVKTADEFLSAIQGINVSIYLDADIDLSGKTFEKRNINSVWRGNIYGQGHTIRNLKCDVRVTGPASLFNSNKTSNFALFYKVQQSHFENFTLEGFDIAADKASAALACISERSEYHHINLVNCKVETTRGMTAGLIASSDTDRIHYCTTDEKCHFVKGGLVDVAYDTAFGNCINRADVYSSNNGVGGICNRSVKCNFKRCFNYGYIHHKETLIFSSKTVGGISSEDDEGYFEECFNYGKIYCDDTYGGGILGVGNNTTIVNCLNASNNLQFKLDKENGGILGQSNNCKVASCLSLADMQLVGNEDGLNAASGDNYRYANYAPNWQSKWSMNISDEILATGKIAYWLNNSAENRKNGVRPWAQNLTGEKDAFPVPDKSRHGVSLEDLTPDRVLSTADDVIAFAFDVNDGSQTYHYVVLDADIDMKGYTFRPIGTSSYPFAGIFDGRGHTIKGITKVAKYANTQSIGFFGTVVRHAEIRNFVIAKGSKIENTYYTGTGGIVGRASLANQRWGRIIIENCGNYADITTQGLAGGIVGAGYGSTEENVQLIIRNCFNMGTIKVSTGSSGLLCGYAACKTNITDCWSGGGLLKMSDSNQDPYDCINPNNGEPEYFAGYEDQLYMANCYVVEPQGVSEDMEQNGVQKLTRLDMASGNLAYNLNGHATKKSAAWHQKIGEDAQPKLFSMGTDDIVYEYKNEGKALYTNDAALSAYDYYGAVRIDRKQNLALLDANSTQDILLNETIQVSKAELNRTFEPDVPSTLMLPFSTTLSNVKVFTYKTMGVDRSTGRYQVVMNEEENGNISAYHPYMVMFDEKTEGLNFEDVTLEPARSLGVSQGAFYFSASPNYKVIDFDDEINESYYGYAGQTFDGFKLGEFVRLGEGATIPPFRCYLRIKNYKRIQDSYDVVIDNTPAPAAAPTRALAMATDGGDVADDDEIDDHDKDPFADKEREELIRPEEVDVMLKAANGETGIAKLNTKTGEFTFEGWYDLNGNRVDKDYQGIRVNGNKKVIVK